MTFSASKLATIASAPRLLGTVSALACCIAASSVTASTFQVTTTAEVRQDVVPATAPNYYHENQGDGDPWEEGFIWFDEAVRVLTEEVNVFDQSQIPVAPSINGPDLIESQAEITGTWTFDASLLYNFDDNIKGSQDEQGDLEGQLLGQTSDVSIFKVTHNGTEVDGGVATTTRVGVANDLVVGEGGERLDVLVIEAGFTNDPNIDSDGIQLQMAFEENWFEQFVDPDLDTDGNFANADDEQLTGDARIEAFFNGVLISAIEYEESATYEESMLLPSGYQIEAGDPMYEMLIVSEAEERELSFVSFGAADGSSEDTPLLPAGVVVRGDESDDTAPTFGFDVSGLGTDIVFIDPELTVGYTYQLEGDGQIAAFVAPSEGAVSVPTGFAGYEVSVVGGPLDGQTFFVMPGERIDFLAEDLVRRLVLTGIPLDAEIDPLDFQTFVAGFGFHNLTSGSFITQTALVVDTDSPAAVPLPAGAWLLLSALAGIAALRRKQTS